MFFVHENIKRTSSKVAYFSIIFFLIDLTLEINVSEMYETKHLSYSTCWRVWMELWQVFFDRCEISAFETWTDLLRKFWIWCRLLVTLAHWPCFQRSFLTLISVLSTKLKLRMQLASSLLSQDQSSFHALLCEAAMRCTVIRSTLG